MFCVFVFHCNSTSVKFATSFLKSATLVGFFNLKFASDHNEMLDKISRPDLSVCLPFLSFRYFATHTVSIFAKSNPQFHHLLYINLALYQVMALNLTFG